MKDFIVYSEKKTNKLHDVHVLYKNIVASNSIKTVIRVLSETERNRNRKVTEKVTFPRPEMYIVTYIPTEIKGLQKLK